MQHNVIWLWHFGWLPGDVSFGHWPLFLLHCHCAARHHFQVLCSFVRLDGCPLVPERWQRSDAAVKGAHGCFCVSQNTFSLLVVKCTSLHFHQSSLLTVEWKQLPPCYEYICCNSDTNPHVLHNCFISFTFLLSFLFPLLVEPFSFLTSGCLHTQNNFPWFPFTKFTRTKVNY